MGAQGERRPECGQQADYLERETAPHLRHECESQQGDGQGEPHGPSRWLSKNEAKPQRDEDRCSEFDQQRDADGQVTQRNEEQVLRHCDAENPVGDQERPLRAMDH